jgi:PhzF family phenazine biosynthesis protein
MKMKIVQIDAFSDKAFFGNPAAVVLLDKVLDDETMLNIAKEMNLSETAFAQQIDEEDMLFEIRYFTITDEVDMCGHATISTLSVLNEYYDLPDIFHIKTKAGKIKVAIENSESQIKYYINQPKGKRKEDNVSRETLEKVLNITDDQLGNSFGIKATIYSTGLYDLLVPISTRQDLNGIQINREEMIIDSKEKDMVGYHCYTIEDEIIYVRNFAPLFGIDEESATGTSNGALLTLLFEKSVIKEGHYKIIQGEEMGKPTTIYGRIDENGIWIGGACYKLFEGELYI